MADKRIYLKQWRKHRGLTQEQVVNRLAILEDPQVPTTTASLSRLENGNQQVSLPVLHALAEIYNCESWELIARDPTKEGMVIDMLRRLDEKRQAQVAAFILGLEANGDAA